MDLRINLDQGRVASLPLIYSEAGNILLLLDQNGSPIKTVDIGDSLPDFELEVDLDRISVGDRVADKRIALLIEACRSYDESDPKPLPPPFTLRKNNGSLYHIDLSLVPKLLSVSMHGVRFILVIRRILETTEFQKQHLRDIYGMTPTEVELAELLTNGMSLLKASENMSISIWTARSHLRSIFQKTETHRQAELVALLNQAQSGISTYVVNATG